MLPLRRAFAEPAVICQIDQEIRVRLDILAGEMRKCVLKTNQHRSFCGHRIQLKWNGAFARSETALNRRKPFENRQRVPQWNVFAEYDKSTLSIAADESSLWIYQKAAVVIIDVLV